MWSGSEILKIALLAVIENSFVNQIVHYCVNVFQDHLDTEIKF